MIDKQKLEQYRDVRNTAKLKETRFIAENSDASDFLGEWAEIHYNTKCKIEERIANGQHDKLHDNNDYQYERLAELLGRLSCYDER